MWAYILYKSEDLEKAVVTFSREIMWRRFGTWLEGYNKKIILKSWNFTN